MNRGLRWFGVFFVLVWGLPVLACGSSAPPTVTPTKTPVLIYTPTPMVAANAPPLVADTATPVPTAAPVAVEAWVIPVNQSIDRGGVVVTLVDIRFWPGDVPEGADLRRTDTFANAQVIGALQVTVENMRDGKATIYPGQGTLVVGNEQIDLSSTMFFSDHLGGEIFQGVRKHGDIMFALNNVSYDVLHGLPLIYQVGKPRDPDTSSSFADEEYLFQVQIP